VLMGVDLSSKSLLQLITQHNIKRIKTI